MVSRRPPGGWLLGWDGPAVELPGWACAWLEQETDLPRRRAALRGADPAVDSVLIAVRAAAMYWRDSGSGSGSVDGPTLADHPAPATALDSGAPLLDAAEAAAVVGITDRGVRRAIAAGRLPARQAAGRWLIAEADANRYRDRRKAP